MKIDRELQKDILLRLRDAYPGLSEIDKLFNADDEHIQGNLFYLAEHDLIEAGAIRDLVADATTDAHNETNG